MPASLLAACSSMDGSRQAEQRPLSASEGRALVAKLLPDGVKDRNAWATDIFAAFAALEIAPTPRLRVL